MVSNSNPTPRTHTRKQKRTLREDLRLSNVGDAAVKLGYRLSNMMVATLQYPEKLVHLMSTSTECRTK